MIRRPPGSALFPAAPLFRSAGTIALNDVSNAYPTDLVIDGDVSLTGGGAVTMSNATGNRIYGKVGTNRLTNVDNTISGTRQVRANQLAPPNQAPIPLHPANPAV